MLDLDEALAGLAADALSRRIWRDQIGMFGLDLLQLIHQTVEFGVADLGIIEHVVAVLVMPNLLAQRVDIFLSVVLSCFHRNSFTTETRRHGEETS